MLIEPMQWDESHYKSIICTIVDNSFLENGTFIVGTLNVDGYSALMCSPRSGIKNLWRTVNVSD